EVQYLGTHYFAYGAADVEPVSIARCTLTTRTVQACDFERERTGRYRLLARSGDAAPAQIDNYVWVTGQRSKWAGGDDAEPQFEWLREGEGDDSTVHFRLTQPFEAADALILLVRGDELLEHHVVSVGQPVQDIVL